MSDRPRRALPDDASTAGDEWQAGDESQVETGVHDRVERSDARARAVSANQPGSTDQRSASAVRADQAVEFDPDDDNFDLDGSDPERRRTSPLAWVIVGVLAVVAVAGVFLVLRNLIGPADQAIAPDRAVEQYLQAVADGDAATALGFSTHTVEDQRLLTDELLAISGNRAPITDIDVVASNDSQVEVDYRMGGEQVTGIFGVSQHDGRWVVDPPWATLQVTENDLRMPFLIDGVELEGPGDYPIFPGNYRVSSSSEYVEIDDSLQVRDNNPELPLGQIPLNLTEAGRNEAVTLIRAELDRCIDSNELQPPNCPYQISSETDDGQVIAESVRTNLQNDPLHGVNVSAVDGAPIAVADLTIEYSLTGQIDSNGSTLDIVERTQTAETTATVAFDQDPPSVGWTQR